MKYGIKLIAIMGLIFLSAGCAFLVSYEGPYKGRILDAETRQPLEGVVVLGVWYSESPTFAGVTGKYYDAKEALTDKNGEFQIPGQGLKVFSNLSRMHVLIFKAGYKYIGMGPWESFKIDPTFKREIAWEGDKAVVSLRKLTIEARKKRLIARPDVSDEKMINLTNELNKERLEDGLSPL